MTRYISTKETAVLVRQALKATFPGTKFSVRMGTGTGSAWLSVSWADGPTDEQVRPILARYEGSVYDRNGDDSYSQNEDTLLYLDGEELPELVHFVCCGINTHRSMSEGVQKEVISRIVEALGGKEFNAENIEWLQVGEARIREVSNCVERGIWQVFAVTDFSPVKVK